MDEGARLNPALWGGQGPYPVEAAVIGGGPAGMTAAVALARTGVETALIALPYKGDNRTTALLDGSVAALDALGIWEKCREAAAPLEAIRLVDDRGGLLRAPEVLFRAEEIDLPAFGYNISNRRLIDALNARASELASLLQVGQAALSVEPGEDAAHIRLADGRAIRAKLVIGADGRNSLCRQAVGIETDTGRYPQTALTANFFHTRPHEQVSTEFHTASGPFTLVPLPGRQSSMVWVVEPRQATRLARLGVDEFAYAAERQAHSILGKFQTDGERGAFPLVWQTARRLATDRVALVGEAAHVVPPIGAQGFNLGLRDAATLAEIVADARRLGADIGSSDTLAAYERARRFDVQSRTMAVDLLNRSLLTDFLPFQGLRGFGLELMHRVGPLRRALMREGVAPRLAEPRLMRGELP
jgi:2-octaprenyl-6-methoxyphenol hydroxylase